VLLHAMNVTSKVTRPTSVLRDAQALEEEKVAVDAAMAVDAAGAEEASTETAIIAVSLATERPVAGIRKRMCTCAQKATQPQEQRQEMPTSTEDMSTF
jgi:hypothetical protein